MLQENKILTFFVTMVRMSAIYIEGKPESQIIVHRIVIKFRKTMIFKIMGKITAKYKGKSLTRTELHHRIYLEFPIYLEIYFQFTLKTFEIFENYSG